MSPLFFSVWNMRFSLLRSHWDVMGFVEPSLSTGVSAGDPKLVEAKGEAL
jgi:hypothetical protein